MKRKNIIIGLFWCTLLIVSLILLNKLFMPKYMSEIPEGALIAEYYKESIPHDIIFVGDCEVYENISPNILWSEYGISSYIRGSAQQLIWQSSALLDEMISKEKPKAVVFNVLSMKYGTPQSEAYNRMSIDGMKLSRYKIESIKSSMMPDETMLSYIFPLLRYHDRWSEISKEDFKYLFNKDILSDSGYLMNVNIKPVDNIPEAKILPNYEFDEICWNYLNHMRTLCEKNEIEFILIKAPSLYPYWYEQWDDQIKQYAKQYDLKYINFLDIVDKLGIDYKTDTYDSGLHLNVYGAEKLSKWFGQWLKDNIQIEDHRGQAEYDNIWNIKTETYNKRKYNLENIRNAEET